MPVIMKDNVQYAYTTKGTVFHTLSNAEYEALTEEEKMNGDVYCIPDREPILNPDQVWAKIGTETLDIGDDLTDGVNQLNSSKVITLTNTSSWLFNQNVMQNNKVVSLYLELTGITTTETVVGVLPSDVRPSKRIIKDCIVINNNANAVLGHAHFVINTNGNITCKAFGSYSNNFVTLDTQYILN